MTALGILPNVQARGKLLAAVPDNVIIYLASPGTDFIFYRVCPQLAKKRMTYLADGHGHGGEDLHGLRLNITPMRGQLRTCYI
jgi:hypothetical protein